MICALQRVAVVAMGLMLAGCASLSVPAGPPGGPGHWSVQGELSVVTGHESATAWWHLKVAGARRELLVLAGPLGHLVFRLTEMPNEATLEDGRGRHFAAPNASDLARKLTGWPLPIVDFPDWIRGKVALDGSAHDLVVDPQGHPVRLTEDGWRVHFVRYAEFAGVTRPARLVLRDPARGVTVTVVVTRWNPT